MESTTANDILLNNTETSSSSPSGLLFAVQLSIINLLEFIIDSKLKLVALGISGLSLLLLLRRWFSGGRATAALGFRLDGRLALVTGANSGIGLATARELAARGASVCLACRCPDSARSAAESIAAGSASSSVFVADLPLDLASLASVRAFAEAFRLRHRRLHLLVNNAGVMACPEAATADGLELQLGVNHLGHFLLTCLLMEPLRRAGGARVVTVSSRAHEWGRIHWDNLNLRGEYTPFKAYAQSKLANVLFTRALATKLAARGDDVTAYCLHPGAVQTNLGRHQPAYFLALFSAVAWLALKRPLEGAQTSLHCALAPAESLRNGGYYSDCQLTQPSTRARSDDDALRLWGVSERLVGLTAEEKSL